MSPITADVALELQHILKRNVSLQGVYRLEMWLGLHEMLQCCPISNKFGHINNRKMEGGLTKNNTDTMNQENKISREKQNIKAGSTVNKGAKQLLKTLEIRDLVITEFTMKEKVKRKEIIELGDTIIARQNLHKRVSTLEK